MLDRRLSRSGVAMVLKGVGSERPQDEPGRDQNASRIIIIRVSNFRTGRSKVIKN